MPALADRAYELPKGYTPVESSDCSPATHLELGPARGGRFDCEYQFVFKGQRYWVYNNWNSGAPESGHQAILATDDGRGLYSVGQVAAQSGIEAVIFQGTSLRIFAVSLRGGGPAPYVIYALSTDPTTRQFVLVPPGTKLAAAQLSKPKAPVQAKPWTEHFPANDPMFSSVYHAGNFRYRCMRNNSGSNLMNAEDTVVHYKNGTTANVVAPYWLAHRGPACDPRTGKALNSNEEYLFPWGSNRTGP